MNLGPREGQRQPTIDLREYVDGLYSYALILSRNRTEAEDLVQETCLHALRAMERLRPDSNVKSWLFTISRNIWFNQLRQWRTAPEIVDSTWTGMGRIKPRTPRKIPMRLT
jgi:RNA polymerase sigma factor (sigma-70 family)